MDVVVVPPEFESVSRRTRSRLAEKAAAAAAPPIVIARTPATENAKRLSLAPQTKRPYGAAASTSTTKKTWAAAKFQHTAYNIVPSPEIPLPKKFVAPTAALSVSERQTMALINHMSRNHKKPGASFTFPHVREETVAGVAGDDAAAHQHHHPLTRSNATRPLATMNVAADERPIPVFVEELKRPIFREATVPAVAGKSKSYGVVREAVAAKIAQPVVYSAIQAPPFHTICQEVLYAPRNLGLSDVDTSKEN